MTSSLGTGGDADVELSIRGTWQPRTDCCSEVDELSVEFRTRYGVAKAINGVSSRPPRRARHWPSSASPDPGKSVTAQAIMGILDTPPGFITGGEVRYCGHRHPQAVRGDGAGEIRGPEISMVFQDALSALNPVFPVGWQIAEMFRKHRGMNKSDSLSRAVRLMERVQIPGRQAAGEGLPAPVLRRHAAADHDRHGHRAGPGRADRRRADHRAWTSPCRRRS